MPLVKIKLGLSHRNSDGEPLKAGDVFDASPAEMESFGDKFEPAGEDLEQDVRKILATAAAEYEEPEVPIAEVEINATKGAFGLAAEHGISLALSGIIGTGQDGKIVHRDVKAFLNGDAE